MTEELQDKLGTDKPQPEQRPITLIIRIMPDLSCQVEGPIHDKILCYGLLESAKDVIKEYHLKQQSQIIKANGSGFMNFVRGKR